MTSGEDQNPEPAEAAPSPVIANPYRWGLFGVLVVAALLRLHALGAPGLWFLEAHNLFLTRFVDLHGSLLDPRNASDLPVMPVLAWLWRGCVHGMASLDPVSTASDFLLRFPAFIFSMLTVWMAYHAGRAVTRDKAAGLAAAFFCAISPFQVRFGQELGALSLYGFLALLLVYCVVRALEEDRARHWAGLAACETALLYTHFSSLEFLLFINLFFVLCAWAYRRRILKWAIAQAVAWGLAVPALLIHLRARREMLRIEFPWYDFKPGWETGLITFKTFFAGYTPTLWSYAFLFFLGAGLFTLGLYALRRRKPMIVLLVLAVAGPIVADVLMWRAREFSFYHHHAFMASGVAAYLAAGAGVRVLGRPTIVAPLVAACCFYTAPALLDHYAQRLHPSDRHRTGVHQRGDYRAAAALIRGAWEPGDLVAAPSHFSLPSLRHYLDERPLRLSAFPWETRLFMRTSGKDAALFRQELMPRLVWLEAREAGRVWLVEARGRSFEYGPLARPVGQWLDLHMRRVAHHQFFGVEVTLYEHRDSGGSANAEGVP
jgi:hypothetical protein